MNNSHAASTATRLKVGLFTLLGIFLIGAVTVFVNDRPYWWRKCNLNYVNVEDATGLKTKSPIRSLGIEIGYLSSIELSETHVRLGICVTAPVEVLPTTRAYIRAEGFLGDRFLELKPVRFIGDSAAAPRELFLLALSAAASAFATEAHAQTDEREIPVGKQTQDLQNVVSQVDTLVQEMTELTSNLKQAIDPKELRNTMQQLNKTLENASRTLSPEGGLNTTAQRTLAKLEEAIENLRDIMARVNRGEGSVGKLLNDPTYAEEIREAIKNINRLLGKASDMRFVVDIGGEQISGYEGGRGWLRMKIHPRRDRYYLLGASIDPRGKRTITQTTVVSGGVSTSTETTQVEEGGVLINFMVGQVLWERVDVSIGLLHGDGTVSTAFYLGPRDHVGMFEFRGDTYSRGKGYKLDERLSVTLRPFPNSVLLRNIYARGGLESLYRVDGKRAWSYGAGIAFDDEDIKLLFAFL